MRGALLAMILCLSACSTASRTPSAAQSDSLCVNDCLGNGGTREFCQSRCAY
jgi:hypothetical protein